MHSHSKVSGYEKLSEEGSCLQKRRGPRIDVCTASSVKATLFGGAKKLTPEDELLIPQATLFGAGSPQASTEAATGREEYASPGEVSNASSECSTGHGRAQASGSRSDSRSRKRPPRLSDLNEEALGDGDNEAFFTPLMTPSVEQQLAETRESAQRQTHEFALRSFRGQNEFALRSPVAVKAEELKHQLDHLIQLANLPMVATSDGTPSRSPFRSPLAAPATPSLIETEGVEEAEAGVLARSAPQPGTQAAAQELRAARARLSNAADAAARLMHTTSPKGASSRSPAVLTPSSRATYANCERRTLSPTLLE